MEEKASGKKINEKFMQKRNEKGGKIKTADMNWSTRPDLTSVKKWEFKKKSLTVKYKAIIKNEGIVEY